MKIKTGVIGMGYIGVTHLETLRRLPFIEIVAVADVNQELAGKWAKIFGIEKCYSTIEEMLANEEIQVIHNCTPNHMHFDINKKVLAAGRHIFSEKPLTGDLKEARELVRIRRQHPGVVAGVDFCYRMYPLIREMRERVLAGELGTPRLVHGEYLQDWLLYDTDYNWRVESQYGGKSRCVADIGSHWLDLAQCVTNSKVIEVCAHTVTALPYRKKPKKAVGTFTVAAADSEMETVKVDTEDYAGVLLKFDKGASGVMQCSQISAGRKCFIDLEVDGETASFHWNHEHPNHRWKGKRDTQNQEIMRNPLLAPLTAGQKGHLGAGHAEGWNDALKNNMEGQLIHAF